ncbi:MAG: hypothetical protein JWP83_5714 [Mycobacterium sp.]|jgi:uncharacterized membrane protein HdeD (DUF308 family)|uniref:HdeD family acid-resistance protein n=1 Tax=Mycobacterium sp. TaxID=1785 RepID=UPI0026019A16|nr:HdeD family acid-resistance protein [Mycobacterium sp.]MCW2664562.1 hypothetical protein [Mycobacterium sp.]
MSAIHRPISGVLQGIWKATIPSGLLAMVLGGVMLAWPEPSVVAAAVLFGMYLIVSGAALVFLAFALPISGGSRFLTFVCGVASVVLGVLAFCHFGEGYATVLLAICVATGFIVRGFFAAASAIGVPKLPGRGWAMFFGTISILAGLVVLAYPSDSIETLALVVGAWLTILGAVEVVSGFAMRSDVKKLEKVTGTAATVTLW